MSDPPSTKSKSSFMISMPIDRELRHRHTQISSIHRIDGLNWLLQAKKRIGSIEVAYETLDLSLHCEGDDSSKLWRTDVKYKLGHEFPARRQGSKKIYLREGVRSLNCWNQGLNRCGLDNVFYNHGCNVFIEIENEVESYPRRPILDPNSSIHDAILVLEGKKFHVNKKDLSSESSYFDRLFYGGFKESNQEEIEIKDANSEDFDEVIKLMYGISTEPITVENVARYLKMADMFDLAIVKEQVENRLLSTDIISIHRKILIAEEHKLEILKSEILRLYKNNENLLSLKNSPEFEEFSDSMKNLLFETLVIQLD